MAKNTKKRKTINLSLPETEAKYNTQIALPYNGIFATPKNFSFSFACFDRTHELFNLGDDRGPDGTISGAWFLSLLDCLKDVSNKRISDLRTSIHDLHPVDWEKANTRPPAGAEQLDFWQFRLNKSLGRVIGIKVESTFYIVWLDPHHNLTDSAHYETAKSYRAGMSEYEKLLRENELLMAQNKELLPYKELYDAE